MIGERTIEGWQLRLRPRGFGRYVSGAFLAFWLCGWAAGEAFALWMLVTGAVSLLTGKPPGPGHAPLEAGPALMIGVFLLFWLAMWTFGGIAAFSELFRLLWGEDRLMVSSGRLVTTHVRGPFRRVRVYERSAIQRISLVGREERMVLDTDGRRVGLSRLGSPAERREAAVAIRAELGISETPSTGTAMPNGWDVFVTPEGERALVSSLATRRAQARFAGILTWPLPPRRRSWLASRSCASPR